MSRRTAPAIITRPRHGSGVSVTDLFCGAGGSSLGATEGGAEVKIALNHWSRAVQTHQQNFPDTFHEVADVSQSDPRRYPATDLLIASPECTNHTLAKGAPRNRQLADLWGAVPDEAEERSRATMWDVPRYAERHAYECIIVENVTDAADWVMWTAWLEAMHLLGYEHECVWLNSMFAHPTPQSRDRLYVVFWRKGNRKPNLAFTPPAWCEHCGRDVAAVQSWKKPARHKGKYRFQYLYRCPACAAVVEPYYYCAANAIDWSLPLERIGDRKRPLRDRTRERIRVGLERYAGQVLPGTLFSMTRDDRPRGLVESLPTQTGTQDAAVAIHPAFLFTQGAWDEMYRHLGQALPTATGSRVFNLVGIPFVLNQDRTEYSKIAGVLADPLPTLRTGSQSVVVPFIAHVGHGGPENAARFRPATRETGTLHPMGGSALVAAPFLVDYYGEARVHGLVEALGAQSSRQHHAVVVPRELPDVDDCGFRVLKPHEIKAGMAFPADYVVTGTVTEQVRQLGQAVTPPAMKFLIDACLATLAA